MTVEGVIEGGQTTTISAAVANSVTFVGRYGVEVEGADLFYMHARTAGSITSGLSRMVVTVVPKTQAPSYKV